MDDGCICKGNWRLIVSECAPLLGKRFADKAGKEWIFHGILHGEDDFYYSMFPVGGGISAYLTCVSSIDGQGYHLIEDVPGFVANASYDPSRKPYQPVSG